MASGTAIEECDRSFTSPCSQVGCLHASSSLITKYNIRERATAAASNLPTLDPPTASSSNPEPHPMPDPVSQSQPGTSLNQKRHAGHPNANGKPWEREPDKYVMKKCYHPAYDEHSKFKVIVSETPVLIAHLRPSEQHAAYEALLARAPRHKIPEYYTLHLFRLAVIHETIAREFAAYERRRRRERGANVAKRSSGSRQSEWVEREEAEGAFQAYREALGRSETLRANERGVVRLLEMCERVMGGEEGFEKVVWRGGK